MRDGLSVRKLLHVSWFWVVLCPVSALSPQADIGTDITAIADEITAIYRAHAPEKLDKVPGLLNKYADAERELLLSVREKYGVSDATQSPPATAPDGQGGKMETRKLAEPVETTGSLADLPGAVGQLHVRKLGAVDMRGLFGDTALPEFLRRWGEAPLLAKGVHHPATISQFFSVSAMHTLLAGTKGPKGVFARDGFDFDKNAIPSSSPTNPPSPFAVYLAGGTVFMNFVERHYPPVAALTCWLAEALGTKAQTNAYLTPPNAQGFTAHTDSQDVLIVQLEGVKAWRVYHPRPIDNPFEKHMIRDAGNALRWGDVATLLNKSQRPILSTPSQKSEAERVLGAPVEYVLQPGDVLYVPRGSPHEAFTLKPEGSAHSDTTGSAGVVGSLHLTLGLVTESDARYWMIRNQLLALCKQRHQKGITCAGHVGEAIIALKDDPLRGGWLRGSPPFGWATNTTIRVEEFDRIWSHLERELPSFSRGVTTDAIVALREQIRASVDEQVVIDQEHTGFLSSEMALCNPSSMNVADALRYRAPALGSKGSAPAATGKGIATLDACLAFVAKGSFSVSKEEQTESGSAIAHTLLLKGVGRGGGRKAAKKGKIRFPIADGQVVEAIKFLNARQKQECDGLCARGFVVGALPGADSFSKLALAQMLVKHGVATVEETVDVYNDTSESSEDQQTAFAQADTLCNLSVQQRFAEAASKEL